MKVRSVCNDGECVYVHEGSCQGEVKQHNSGVVLVVTCIGCGEFERWGADGKQI